MSTAGPPLADSTEKAIDFKIGHEFNQLRDMVNRYVVEQESAANSRALGLQRGYQHLRADLVPEMLDRVIAYCLDLQIRDADLITLKIRTAFEPQLKALGQSLGISFQSPSTGMTMRVIMEFKGWVDAYCAGIASRVHTAVERRRHMDPPPDPPPEPPQRKEPVGAIYNITGPTQINTGSPSSTQTNTDAVPEPAKRPTKLVTKKRVPAVAIIPVLRPHVDSDAARVRPSDLGVKGALALRHRVLLFSGSDSSLCAGPSSSHF